MLKESEFRKIIRESIKETLTEATTASDSPGPKGYAAFLNLDDLKAYIEDLKKSVEDNTGYKMVNEALSNPMSIIVKNDEAGPVAKIWIRNRIKFVLDSMTPVGTEYHVNGADYGKAVKLAKGKLVYESVNEGSMNATKMVKIFKNKDDWGDTIDQVYVKGGNLVYIDSFFYGQDKALKDLVKSWSKGGSNYEYFNDVYGIDIDIVDTFSEFKATGRHKKLTDTGIVGVVLKISGGSDKPINESKYVVQYWKYTRDDDYDLFDKTVDAASEDEAIKKVQKLDRRGKEFKVIKKDGKMLKEGIFKDKRGLVGYEVNAFVNNYKKINPKNMVKDGGDGFVYGFRKGDKVAHWKLDKDAGKIYSDSNSEVGNLIHRTSGAKLWK